jgi:hypothetical protein
MEKRYYVIENNIIELVARSFFKYDKLDHTIYTDWGSKEKIETIKNIINLADHTGVGFIPLEELICRITSSWECGFNEKFLFKSKKKAEIFIKNKLIKEIIE